MKYYNDFTDNVEERNESLLHLQDKKNPALFDIMSYLFNID